MRNDPYLIASLVPNYDAYVKPAGSTLSILRTPSIDSGCAAAGGENRVS